MIQWGFIPLCLLFSDGNVVSPSWSGIKLTLTKTFPKTLRIKVHVHIFVNSGYGPTIINSFFLKVLLRNCVFSRKCCITYAFFTRNKKWLFKQKWMLSLQTCLYVFPVLRYSLVVIIPQLPECIIYNIVLCKSTHSRTSCTHPAGYHCHSKLFPVNTASAGWFLSCAQSDFWASMLEVPSYKHAMESKYNYRYRYRDIKLERDLFMIA